MVLDEDAAVPGHDAPIFAIVTGHAGAHRCDTDRAFLAFGVAEGLDALLLKLSVQAVESTHSCLRTFARLARASAAPAATGQPAGVG